MKGTFFKFLAFSTLFFAPPLAMAAETQDTTGHTAPYTVQKGDCLWNISKRFYQNSFEWPLVYHHNQPLIQDPDKIDVGWMLVIPEEVGSGEVNQAIRFALDYKGLTQTTAHRRAASPEQAAMRQGVEKNQPSAGASSAQPSENQQVSSSAPGGPAASNVPGQASSNAAQQPSVPSPQAGGSAGTVVAVIVVVVLAGVGIWWWRARQGGKQTQEPFRLSQAPQADEAAAAPPPVAAAPSPGPQASQPLPPSDPPAQPQQPGLRPPGALEQPGQTVSTQEQLFQPSPSGETPAQGMPQPMEAPAASTPVPPDSASPQGTQPPPPAPGEKPKDENHRDVA